MLQPDDIFIISKNSLIAKLPCSIVIDEREYDDRTFIETSQKITIPGILQFYVPSLEDYVQIILTYPVDVLKTNNMSFEKHTTIINYDEGDITVTKDYIVEETDIGLLIRLLQGRVKYIKEPKILLNMLHDIISGVDLVHLELIISNMFRNHDDLNQKCRITGSYSNSEILGQQKQPFQDSWESSMAFQYIDRAITSGLIDKKQSDQNPIEKVLNEDFKKL